MSRRVVVVGAGVGGLAAAVRLARSGYPVELIEARPEPGGLAGGRSLDGFPFDAGPYILLDRPGLAWAFAALGLDLGSLLDLRKVESLYEVTFPDGPPVRFHADLERTAAGLEAHGAGAGERYRRFVEETRRRYERLAPLQRVSRPGVAALLRTGAWRDVPFLLRPLGRVLRAARLPGRVAEAVAIWTHVAGQSVAAAPSPLAFVPALVHSVGAYLPAGGIAAVPEILADAATRAGVVLRCGTRVRSIDSRGRRVTGVTLADGERIEAQAVVSDAGLATYLTLADAVRDRPRRKLEALPLQSPGVCAYLAVRGPTTPPYLRFRLPGGSELCRLFVRPAVVCPELVRAGWQPARLIAPLRHGAAEMLGPDGERAFLDRVLAEPWWREGLEEYRVLATRTPTDWGEEFSFYRRSMNPVMTAAFMRAGRLAHRSPHLAGLYLCGSATHPGQWVSFCAVSGVLAADRLREDRPC